MNKIKIDLIGDPLLDYWNDGEKITLCLGGAANVEQNIISLLSENYLTNNKIDFSVGFSTPWVYGDKYNNEGLDCGRPELYPAKLYLLELDQQSWTSVSAPGHPFDARNSPISTIWNYQEDIDYMKSILIVSDYNKGFVSKNLESLLKEKKYDLCIVDSRYGNTNFSFLRDISECLIYRRTKSTDVNSNFSWDFKIETDGDNPVVLYNHNEEDLLTVPVLFQEEPESTCGAGDVFTASIACYLASYYSGYYEEKEDLFSNGEQLVTINELLKGAIMFAQLTCEEAIQLSYTCVVNKIKL